MKSITRRVIHWGPILALTVISTIFLSTMACIVDWWPIYSLAGFIHLSIYLFWAVATLYNFFNAMVIGPGYVPQGWSPKHKADRKNLQECIFCEAYKSPRSHHCRKCDRCVFKMDHHCPWINNCVGHFNHSSFTYFLFFAPCGCVHSMFVLIAAMYRALNRNYYLLYGSGDEPIVNIGVYTFISCMFSVGLAVGVVLAVGGLCVMQLRGILKNETGIESWIIDKAEYREREEEEGEFVYPYNLGRWNNLKMVFHPERRLDGIWWPVREGCNQYTLTIEQIKQKKEKAARSVVCEIKERYSGSIVPITKGCRVCCCPPCTDESRMAVAPGDLIRVSRWKKHWIYGDKVKYGGSGKPEGVKRARGWFPKRCAVVPKLDGCGDTNETSENAKKDS